MGFKTMDARNFLRFQFKQSNQINFGVKDDAFIEKITAAWMNDRQESKFRFESILKHAQCENQTSLKILDMASGCGSFVFYALLNGYQAYGVEPEGWKLEFIRKKSKEYDYPNSWLNHFIRGCGEQLPFRDQCFDIISSYQTLEHVDNIHSCLEEMDRCLKNGGVLHLQFPDYGNSFFEGHYRIPVWPSMNRNLFRLYLKLLGKPNLGLETINDIRPKVIKDFFHGKNYIITDLNHAHVKERIRKKLNIHNSRFLSILAKMYLASRMARNFLIRENSSNLLLFKSASPSHLPIPSAEIAIGNS